MMNCICVRVLHVYLRLFLLGRSKPPRRSRTLHGGGALMLKASKVDVEGATEAALPYVTVPPHAAHSSLEHRNQNACQAA